MTVLVGTACSSRSGLKPAGGTAGSGGTAQGGHAGGLGSTSSAGGVVSGGVSGAGAGASGTSTCLVTECIAGPCVPAGQPRPNLCGCPIRDCEPDGGVGGSAGTAEGGAISTGGNGGTTGSGNCTFVDGGTPPAFDEVTLLSFSTSSTIPSNLPPPVQITVTDATKAQDAYRATLALPVAPTGVQPGYHSCPGDWGVTYRLTFSLASGGTLTVVADPNGCQSVSIPGTCVRSADSAYWSQLAQDLGIPESEIYPYSPNIVQPPDAGAAACTKDTDCLPGLNCGYAVADGCAAKGVCVQSNCQKNACLTPAGMCGCDGQTILPVQSQQPSPNSITIVYASAPSSGRIGPCTSIVDAGSAGCTWQGKVIPVGQKLDAGDGCNTCECTVAGIACTARACSPPDAPTLVCSLPYALTFGSNGGKVAFQDSFTLDTAGHLTVTRNDFHSTDGPSLPTCSPALPACGASGVVSISTIALDLTDSEVQFAFGLTLSHVYGVDNRPSDGAVWSITRASGGNILVGNPCPSPYMNSCQPIPAGIQRLADDLRSLAYTAEALPACAGL
ncbi:MAG TPA: hypothetical protein VJ860_02220 [Polyangia bacterium]|nr:hypothetical protein [Polyangia bacterium]